MRIQHNILAMNAYRNYNTNTSALSKNLEKLSSGYKINRAGDDAAGLAISEKMRAQITGLNAAQKNVKDGISLVKTAEGAMQEIQDMLNRMDYLATQSANGTYDNEVDRANLQKEVEALKSEINRIADSANFNGIKLLDGENAEAKSISALGELDKDAMIDGTNPTKGGNAIITVNMSGAAGSTPSLTAVQASTDAAKTYDGVAPNAATKDTLSFKVADETAAGASSTKLGLGTGTEQVTIVTDATGTPTKISDLATAKDANGNLLKDAYDISVDFGGGVVKTGWTDNTNLAAGATITLTAKAAGATSNDLSSVVTDTDGAITYTKGHDEGQGAAASNATYSFDLDLSKLAGGQKLSFGGTDITITDAQGGNTAAGTLSIFGKDFTLTADTDTDGTKSVADDLVTALGSFSSDYNIEVTHNAGTATVKLTAKTAGAAGNKGEFAFTNNPTDLVSNYSHVAGADAGTGTAGKVAQATFESEDLKLSNLQKVGTQFKLGNQTYEVVDNTATPTGNQIKASDVTKAKIEELIKTNICDTELSHGANFVYDDTNGKITLTGTETKASTVDALKGATIQVANAPAAGTKASNKASGWAGLEIEVGQTTLQNLKDKEISVDGKNVKLGDLFDITATNATSTISANSVITFTAKQTGKLSDAVMNAVTYDDNASSEVRDGWDEGTTGAGNNTHYELNISTDNTELAGGASFTFGTGNKTYTFDITYDDVETDNGTVTNPADGTEVSNGREKIKLSNTMTDQEKADAIKTAVAAKLTDFNVKASVNSGSIKLEATAKTATRDTNYGGVRYSSAGGAFTGGVYNAYNAFDGGTEGTYAQVSYDFDPSKLKAGDKVTIGGTTITVGEADATERDANGKVTSITIAETKAQTASELISAFESAGFQSGQLAIAGGKLTITGQTTGQTAEDLAKAMGVKVTSSRVLTEGGLTLQIGDTSDSYNQLTVSIGDMHTDALGISGIDISNQSGASAAIQTIRDAINQVSSVRGDLGATQNRLEHTANNLSVMAENIQDAESTIRDTDIAEEMMAYTKNNILVQSAQAMLAQANAVPQGVLQLLG